MIRLARATTLLGTDRGHSNTSWSDERTRVYVVRARGLRVDSGPLGVMPLLRPDRTVLSVPLGGALHLRRSRRDHELAPGHFAFEAGMRWDERWLGPAFRVLVVEQGGAPATAHAETQRGTLSRGDLARVAALADQLEHGGRDEAAQAIRSLDELLRASGVHLEGLGALPGQTEDPRDEATAALLSGLRTGLHLHPSWVDAVDAAGRGERQLRRDVTRLFRRLELPLQGLRELLVRERLLGATVLLSAPDASVARVATSVGFRSARALGLALRRAGLPSATAIASRACGE